MLVESHAGLQSSKQQALLEASRREAGRLLPFLVDPRQSAYLAQEAGKQGVFVRELFEAIQFALSRADATSDKMVYAGLQFESV